MSEYRLPQKSVLNYNPKNGQFIKGIVPHNKGKRWNEWMSKKGQKKALKGLARNGNPNLWKSNARKVMAIRDGKVVCVFLHSNDAERKTGICGRNIRSVCAGKRKTAGGYKWCYADGKWL